MPWVAPTPPTSGTTITTAWASTNIVDPANWLRRLTGNADPPGADYVAVSTGTTLTSWAKIPDAALADAKVSKTAPTTSNLNTALLTSFYEADSAAGAIPYVEYWQVLNLRQNNLAAHHAFQFAAALSTNTQYVRQIASGVATAWAKIWTEASDGAGSGLDADTLDGVQGSGYAVAARGVPSGLIAAFASAGAIASGWTRFTNGDGRFLVGDGTTFSQTFVEGASAGSSWAHLHGTSSVTVQSGTGASVASGNTSNATWIPPSFAVVWSQKT